MRKLRQNIFFCLILLSILTVFACSSALAQKRESDLTPPTSYAEVRGSITKEGYRNSAFGFTISPAPKGFIAEVSDQEGAKYNFAHPTARADDRVFSIYESTFKNTLRFYQSHVEAHEASDAEGILASDLYSGGAKVTEKNFAGRKAAYAKTMDNGIVNEYYALIVNGFYIKWVLTYDSKDAKKAEPIKNTFNSIRFDWIED